MIYKPVIGLSALWDDDKQSYWMLPGYIKGIEEAGGIAVMLPVTGDREAVREVAGRLDGFVFTGGHDVGTAVYGEDPRHDNIVCCPERDENEKLLLEYVLESRKPALGICRGIQFINAALGGTLYQDLPKEHPSATEHHQTPPYDKVAHTVILNPDSPLAAALGTTEIPVNSYHHQAIKELAPSLRAMGAAPDGIIEAVYRPDMDFLWAVQWHPEFSYETSPVSKKIFYEFVAAAKKLAIELT